MVAPVLIRNLLPNLSFMFFVEAKAATKATSFYQADCGGCGRLRLFPACKDLCAVGFFFCVPSAQKIYSVVDAHSVAGSAVAFGIKLKKLTPTKTKCRWI